MPLKTLEENWNEYRNACYPAKNGPISKLQETETRQAFFAGCLIVLNTVSDGIGSAATAMQSVKTIKDLQSEAMAVCRERIYEMKEKN